MILELHDLFGRLGWEKMNDRKAIALKLKEFRRKFGKLYLIQKGKKWRFVGGFFPTPHTLIIKDAC